MQELIRWSSRFVPLFNPKKAHGGNLPLGQYFRCHFVTAGVKRCALLTFPEYDWATKQHDRDQFITFQ